MFVYLLEETMIWVLSIGWILNLIVLYFFKGLINFRCLFGVACVLAMLLIPYVFAVLMPIIAMAIIVEDHNVRKP